jgi:hypothetical protein
MLATFVLGVPSGQYYSDEVIGVFGQIFSCT